MKLQIIITPNVESLAQQVGNFIKSKAHEAIDKRGRFTLVLTGGGSPVPL